MSLFEIIDPTFKNLQVDRIKNLDQFFSIA